jgi:hypothetical protein
MQQLSLAELCQKTSRRVELGGNRGRTRDVVDALRTRAWLGALLADSGKSSFTATQAAVEEVRCGRRVSHSGKWLAYRDGASVPREDLVEAAATFAARSKWALRHVLWDTLRVVKPASTSIDSWAAQLAPGAGAALRRAALRKGCSTRDRKRLERDGGLDGIAAMTALLRVEVERGRLDAASSWVMPIFKTLILCGDDLLKAGIAQAMPDYYEQVIFPLIGRAGGQAWYTTGGLPMRETVFLFDDALRVLQEAGVALNADARHDVLDGVHGWEVLGLMPYLTSTKIDIDPHKPFAPQCDYRLFALWKLWGLARLRCSYVGAAPPPDLESEQGKWAVLRQLTLLMDDC